MLRQASDSTINDAWGSGSAPRPFDPDSFLSSHSGQTSPPNDDPDMDGFATSSAGGRNAGGRHAGGFGSKTRRGRNAGGFDETSSDDRHSAPHEPRQSEPRLYEAEPFVPVPVRYEVTLDESAIDPDVQKVLRRLMRHGFEAYAVGGCVRDLLLGRRPKDFDVATSARPEDVRDLFRNSRIIGRRFRLVHVLFQGGKVIEVATFRKNPKEETDADDTSELLIRSDNVFGEAHEDAVRRDFTMNALFYDIEAREILDWVGGMEDLRRSVVHTIGEPEVRFREDPVRILRAIKFAGRLGFGMTPDVYDAIVACRESLQLAARPRVSEEILRLMRGGAARRTIYLAWETGVLDVLLPELSALLYDDDAPDGPGRRLWRVLSYIDERTLEEGPLDDTVLWTLLLLEPLKEACDGARDRAAAAADFLEPMIERLAISRRYADGIRRIISLLPRVAAGRVGRFARTELFIPTLSVAAAALFAEGRTTEPIDRLRKSEVARKPRKVHHVPQHPGYRIRSEKPFE